MHRYLILALMLSFHSFAASAGTCQGKTASCFDGCTSSYVTFVNQDSCGDYFDSDKRCYRSYGYCNEPDPAPPKCQGKVASCFDGCTTSYRNFPNADQCGSYFNADKRCYETYAYCGE